MSSETAGSGEKTLLLIKEHWMQYGMPTFLIVASWTLFAICTALSSALMAWNHTASVAALITGHVLLLLFHHAAFYRLFSNSTTRILLTNKRILSSQGSLWLRENMIDIPLWKIRSLEIERRGLLPHLLNYGSILLNRRELPSLPLIPHPQAVHSRIVSQLQEMQTAFGNTPGSGTLQK
jgi:hypothetical protein